MDKEIRILRHIAIVYRVECGGLCKMILQETLKVRFGMISTDSGSWDNIKEGRGQDMQGS